MRAAPLWLALLLVTGAAPPGATDASSALREGNRLFRNGDLEEALEVYAAGYDGSDPLLAYNLGTTAHHLGRLPEALLWYRRAEGSLGRDPWLKDNLELVRQQLGVSGGVVEPESSPSGWGFWLENRRRMVLAGACLAWAALALLLVPLPPRVSLAVRQGLTISLALLSCVTFLAGMLLLLRGPRAAVLLRDCAGVEASLPAGSELWVLPAAEDGWRVLGREDQRCPAEAVGLVDPAFRRTGSSGIVSTAGPARMGSRTEGTLHRSTR